MRTLLAAGAATVDITPGNSQFLFGYPHVERYSTGTHDPLLSSGLYLSDGATEVMFIANDIIFVTKDMVGRVRVQIEQATGIPAGNIMVTATHTHSGPLTLDCLSNEADPTVPKTDAKYVQFMEQRIAEAGIAAYESAQPARLGLAIADATGIGSNRRDPKGPADLNVPVLLVRSAEGEKNIAAMLVCCMHPTVLHEDSTLISGDFPAMARQYLQEGVLGRDCPVLYHTGPQGNQSPRHVTTGNTFAEATRLGAIVGRAVEKVIAGIEFSDNVGLSGGQGFVELVPREFPTVTQAEEKLKKAVDKLQRLRVENTPHAETRTAECDWFGAEETVTLAKAARDGKLDQVRKSAMPAEVHIITVGKWQFVGWPGEMFVEYGLAVKEKSDNTFVIALANGELQGYIVTAEAEAEGGYEASNGLFAAKSGDVLVEKTLAMLAQECR